MLVIVDAQLALYAAVAMPLITLLVLRFAHLVSPISTEIQARKGDVTEMADEAVVGIEMVQAFGREDLVRDRFGERARGGPRARSCDRPASRRATCPGSSTCRRCRSLRSCSSAGAP